MAKVLLENLSKSYSGPKKSTVHAVSELNLEIGDGEFVVLVGPSGCGKTTTLRMIAGLEEVDGGHIYMDDTRVNDLHPKDRDIAMVFQNYALYPHLNVIDNMSLGLKLRKYSKAEIQLRVEEASAMLGIADLLDRMPHQLSGGQRQRVAVGRALVRRPKVFLFDEPLSNLDAQMRLQMRMELTELHQKLAATMIYVTHDQAEAMTMGDRIVVMNHGQIQQADRPVQVYQHPKNTFVAGFIGSPPMNLLEARRESDDADWTIGEIQLAGIWSGSQKTAIESLSRFHIGFRPESASLNEPQSAQANTSLRLEGSVQWIETTGADTFMHLSIGGQKCIIRQPAQIKRSKGESLTVYVSGDQLQLFHAETGERIEVS